MTPGTRVRLDSTGEVGVVVHTWFNPEIGMDDCYVAFFGTEFPDGQPNGIPYVLRYAANSLDKLD